MRMPPREFLRRCLDYNPDTGELKWKDRPRSDFTSNLSFQFFKSRVGYQAFSSPNGEGYHSGSITYNRVKYTLKRHMVVWLLMTDDPLPETIDHKDGNRSNDRWNNLRAATRSQNNKNSKGYGKYGKGVRRHRSGRYYARIFSDGHSHYLGSFDLPEQAQAAYAEAAKRLHGDFARPS